MSFSKRIGVTPLTKPAQLSDIDKDLKNSLWNVFYAYVLEPLDGGDHFEAEGFKPFVFDLWWNFLKEPVDKSPSSYNYLQRYLREYFFSKPWFNIYELIEFTLTGSSREYFNIEDYSDVLNTILEREYSGYRVINGLIAPIINDLEIDEINEALESSKQYTSISNANIHLKNALFCISNKETPDYRNAIKESISAVESVVRTITDENTLGEALKKIESKGLKINNQLKESFGKVYNYTNDKNAGIRHAVIGEHEAPDYETAKYLLVASSAFVNYLIGLAVKENILTAK
jgi:hypothetical protein